MIATICEERELELWKFVFSMKAFMLGLDSKS